MSLTDFVTITLPDGSIEKIPLEAFSPKMLLKYKYGTIVEFPKEKGIMIYRGECRGLFAYYSITEAANMIGKSFRLTVRFAFSLYRKVAWGFAEMGEVRSFCLPMVFWVVANKIMVIGPFEAEVHIIGRNRVKKIEVKYSYDELLNMIEEYEEETGKKMPKGVFYALDKLYRVADVKKEKTI